MGILILEIRPTLVFVGKDRCDLKVKKGFGLRPIMSYGFLHGMPCFRFSPRHVQHRTHLRPLSCAILFYRPKGSWKHRTWPVKKSLGVEWQRQFRYSPGFSLMRHEPCLAKLGFCTPKRQGPQLKGDQTLLLLLWIWRFLGTFWGCTQTLFLDAWSTSLFLRR